MTKAQRKLFRKERRARIAARIKRHRLERKERIAKLKAARKLRRERIKARRERIKKLRELRNMRRRAILQKLTRKQRCRIFALKFKCMRKRFHFMKRFKRHILRRYRRTLKILRLKFDREKYMEYYRLKLNNNQLIHFKRFNCKTALHYLRKLRIQKRNLKRKFYLKRRKMLKLKYQKISVKKT